MTDSPQLVALRKALAAETDGLDTDAKKQMADDTIVQILDALGRGVLPLGMWEQRCLAAAIISIRGGRYDEARSMARRALWPEENRRISAIARFPLRPGMLTVEELGRELEAARNMKRRSAPGKTG